MSPTPFRIGTRGSQLALWQAHHIADQLRAHGHTVEIEVIRTTGDRMQDPAFRMQAAGGASGLAEDLAPNGTGIFIREIEDALAAGRIDLAVHSLKDLPTTLDPRFELAAVPARADARDALVCEEFWGLHMLPSGARVGTTSPRRQAMLLALRPDLRFVPLRGNIDTRLRKWQGGEAEALVLACAGLDRLGRREHVHQRFSVDELCPAPGQGALGLEVRKPGGHARDVALQAAIAGLNDPEAAFAISAERTVLEALGGGCNLPLGAFCHLADDRWHLHAMVAAPDGEAVIHVIERAPNGIQPVELGESAAEALRLRGARDLLYAEPASAS